LPLWTRASRFSRLLPLLKRPCFRRCGRHPGEPVPHDVGHISGLARCRVISRYGVGYDNVVCRPRHDTASGSPTCPTTASKTSPTTRSPAPGGHPRHRLQGPDDPARQWNLHAGHVVPVFASPADPGNTGSGKTGRCLHRKSSGLDSPGISPTIPSSARPQSKPKGPRPWTRDAAL